MNLTGRIKKLQNVFCQLQSTNSIVQKQLIISSIASTEIYLDFLFIIGCLNGLHKFGYKYNITEEPKNIEPIINEDFSVTQLLLFLQQPMLQEDLSVHNITKHVEQTYKWREFLEPIVNRTLRLGIGHSLIEKTKGSPMLAKKFEGEIAEDPDGYYITEKLDGNRCLSYYEDDRWHFISRNGKEMNVSFDMSSLPHNLVFDGEVLSPEQVELSEAIFNHTDIVNTGEFNATSGLINSKSEDKKLIYNIFDIVDTSASYKERRALLNSFLSNPQVRILPLFAYYPNSKMLQDNIYDILDYITAKGGEGVMINLGSAPYEQKRTSSILKFKKVQTIDMRVTKINLGEIGKYKDLVGSIHCEIVTSDGKNISCDVGSGLNDLQRLRWAQRPELILNKIVEIAYFSISQSKDDKTGENQYSLRFPRFKIIRNDKTETSEY